MNRRGMLSLYLLLSMAGLLTGISGFIFAAAHAVRTETAVLDGLRAQYAAESGAVWALEKIKKDGIVPQAVEFSLDGRTKCKVSIQKSGMSVASRGEDTETGTLRYVQLQAEAEKEGETFRVTVQSVEKKKW